MTQEKLPHRKELCLQSEASTTVEAYFCLPQRIAPVTCIGLNTSFGRRGSTRSGGPRPGPTEAERRPHEVRGTSAWTDRSGAETSNSTFTSSITG